MSSAGRDHRHQERLAAPGQHPDGGVQGPVLRQEYPLLGLTVRPSVRTDVAYLADHLRAADLAEIAAASGETPLMSLVHGFSQSQPCLTVTYNDVPAAMFGVVPTPTKRVGIIWMLGTDRIKLFRLAFHRHSREWIARLGAHYDHVFNYIDERNEHHVRWLRRLDFRFLARHEHFGAEGRPFLEFCKTLNHV